jgi:hypothetical protein
VEDSLDEDIVIPIAGMIMIIVIVIGLPLVRSYVKRKERDLLLPRAAPATDERLDRIEHAIDAMAVEVERISEGQRFVTRLLSERAPERVALPPDAHARQPPSRTP